MLYVSCGYIAKEGVKGDFGHIRVVVGDLEGQQWGPGGEGKKRVWGLRCGIQMRRRRGRPVKRHKREEGGELYHGKPNELGAALVGFG